MGSKLARRLRSAPECQTAASSLIRPSEELQRASHNVERDLQAKIRIRQETSDSLMCSKAVPHSSAGCRSALLTERRLHHEQASLQSWQVRRQGLTMKSMKAMVMCMTCISK